MASMSQTSIVGKKRRRLAPREAAYDQKQNAADQVNGVLDVLLLELRTPFVQPCFDAFYQIFHLFPLLF